MEEKEVFYPIDEIAPTAEGLVPNMSTGAFLLYLLSLAGIALLSAAAAFLYLI